jgi:hypothetical protein
MDWPAFLSAAARPGPLADPSPEAAPDRTNSPAVDREGPWRAPNAGSALHFSVSGLSDMGDYAAQPDRTDRWIPAASSLPWAGSASPYRRT